MYDKMTIHIKGKKISKEIVGYWLGLDFSKPNRTKTYCVEEKTEPKQFYIRAVGADDGTCPY